MNVILSSRSAAGLVITLSLMSAHCLADKLTDKKVEADSHNDLFVPDNLDYYNPLKHNQGHQQKKQRRYNTHSTGLTNAQLEAAAEDIRSSDMSSQQRALNYQWLQSYDQDQDNISTGGRVLQKLVKMGFRTYWDGVRNKHYSDAKVLPDSNGSGKITEEVDYKLRMSDDKVKLTFEYEF